MPAWRVEKLLTELRRILSALRCCLHVTTSWPQTNAQGQITPSIRYRSCHSDLLSAGAPDRKSSDSMPVILLSAITTFDLLTAANGRFYCSYDRKDVLYAVQVLPRAGRGAWSRTDVLLQLTALQLSLSAAAVPFMET